MYFGHRGDFRAINANSQGEPVEIVYIGAMGEIQSPHSLLSAWRELPFSYRRRIRLTFIGDANSNQMIRDATDVRVVGLMNRRELLDEMAKFDYGYLSVINRSAFKYVMPSKLYEYIGQAKPILAHIPHNCEASQVIREEGIGLVSTFGDQEKLKQDLMRIVEDPNLYRLFQRRLLGIRDRFTAKETMRVMTDKVRALSELYPDNQQHDIGVAPE